MSENTERILIIMPRQLGDVLLTTSMVPCIKASYPNAEIDWYAHPMASQILAGNNDIHRVLYHPRPLRHYTSKLGLGFFRAVLTLVRDELLLLLTIRSRRYDAVIDVMNNPRTAIATLFSGARVRASFSTRFLRNLAYNWLLPRNELNEGYIGWTRLFLLRAIGCKIPSEGEVSIYLPASASDTEVASKVLADAKLAAKCERFVTLSPTHRRPVRQWPHYASLAFELVTKHNVGVIWLWGPGEEEFVLNLHVETQNRLREKGFRREASVMPPLLTLARVGELARLSSCFIGNSNGLSHMATARGARTLEIHGPTLARTWRFPNPSRNQSIEGPCECKGKNTCKYGLPAKCLKEISVEAIITMIVNSHFI